jgi:DNA-binding transcriptional MerR regulator
VLTIGQLARYAGVTVRAVRHYHAKGLLPEPSRDRSGYRRYDASSVVELIRIRTLADAGVPLSRVRELLDAGEEDFSNAVADIDRRLHAEICAREGLRRRIAELASGDALALPAEAVAYLEQLRQLGVPQRAIDMERDAWILVAAQIPRGMATLMELKRAQIEDPSVLTMYTELVEMAEWDPDDPRLPAVADRLVAMIEHDAERWTEEQATDFDLDDDVAALLDEVFLHAVPVGRHLLGLLEARGWSGWTKLQRIDEGELWGRVDAEHRPDLKDRR